MQILDQYLRTIPSWVLLPMGVLLIALAADYFVKSALLVAEWLKWPSFLIGVVIAGFGTSLPELSVSFSAALKGQGGIALGNVLGSNVANIGLILGTVSIISPIPFKRRIINKELPFLGLATVVVSILMYFNCITPISGVGLLVLFSVYLHGQFKQRSEGQEEHKINFWKVLAAFLGCIIFLGLIFCSAHMIVTSACTIAKKFGISEVIIGLTLVAIGTSLPELVISIMSAIKGHCELAIGNIIGSNIFNILLILGSSACFGQIKTDQMVAFRDGGAAVAMVVLLYIAAHNWRHFKQDGIINRMEGVVLLLAYLGYISILLVL